jgi:uncharacterized protein (TIGR03437 family)
MATRKLLNFLAAAAFSFLCLSAQTPVFEAIGVLNAASVLGSGQQGIAPEMLLTIKGQYLAASVAEWNSGDGSAATLLAGTTVTFNRIAAPLLYVSPNQINVQVPSVVRGAATADIVVTTAAGSSLPVTAMVGAYSF